MHIATCPQQLPRGPEDYRLIPMPNYGAIALHFALAVAVAPLASSQTQQPTRRNSIAIEADIISYFISGYSGILNVSLHNGFQAALGIGRYDVPSFLLEGDANYDAARWEATVTSVQVFRAGYRFKGPMRNGPALAAVVLNQNWQLRSAPLGGETRFRTLSVGVSGGYYFHIGTHFYIYPTAAFTHNDVTSGSTSVNGTNYTVEEWGPNGSIHIGWEWRF
jgi:hypothetical protein